MTRCLMYCRVSTARQEREGTSLETQEQRCREYAAEHGWTIIAVESEQQSGMHRHRPGLMRFRAMVRSGQADVLLSYDPDRLSRNKRLTRELADECDDYGVDLDFVTETYDDSLEGELRRDIDGYVGAKEHAKICERTMRGRMARVEGVKGQPGKPLPGRRPIYGYRWENPEKKHRLVIDESHTAIVRRIFAEFRVGRSLRAIARGLTEDGIQTPSGRSPVWQACSVRCLLRTTAYIGEYRALTYETVKTTGTRVDKKGQPVLWMTRRPIEATVTLADVAPPLIERAVWEAVQAKLAGHGALTARSLSRDAEALLRGRVVCAHCGGSMQTTSSNGKIVYRCGARARRQTTCPMLTIRAEVLDAPVWHHVLRLLNDPELLRRGVEKVRAEDPIEADIARIDKALAGAREKRQGYLEGAGESKNAGNIAALMAMADALATDIDAWEADRRALRAEHAGWEEVVRDINDIDRWRRERFAAVGDPQDYTLDQKRAWLGWFDLRVVVKRNPSERRRAKGTPLDIQRVNAEWAANQPYTVEARMPLGELPPFGQTVTTNSSYRRNTPPSPALAVRAPDTVADTR